MRRAHPIYINRRGTGSITAGSGDCLRAIGCSRIGHSERGRWPIQTARHVEVMVQGYTASTYQSSRSLDSGDESQTTQMIFMSEQRSHPGTLHACGNHTGSLCRHPAMIRNCMFYNLSCWVHSPITLSDAQRRESGSSHGQIEGAANPGSAPDCSM